MAKWPMGEKRLSKRVLRRILEQTVAQGPPCRDPDCDCERILAHWRRMLREFEAGIPPRHPADRNWEFAKQTMLSAWACMATHSLDRQRRRRAWQELAHPLFMEMLDPHNWPAKQLRLGPDWPPPPEPEPEPEPTGWSEARSRECRAKDETRAKAKQENGK
jgi:hypothetical protein